MRLYKRWLLLRLKCSPAWWDLVETMRTTARVVAERDRVTYGQAWRSVVADLVEGPPLGPDLARYERVRVLLRKLDGFETRAVEVRPD